MFTNMKLKTFIMKIKKAYQAKCYRAKFQKCYDEHMAIKYQNYCNWLKTLANNCQESNKN